MAPDSVWRCTRKIGISDLGKAKANQTGSLAVRGETALRCFGQRG
jgi:hypothetical protein